MKSRNSNIELLRLICIVMIISMHVFGLYKDEIGTAGLAALSFNNAICNLGVSVFMLISGYYGIRYRTDKLLGLWNIALFWSILLLTIDVDHSAKNILRSFFPVFTGKYWFLTAYIVIYCLSSYIEKLIASITQRQFQLLLATLLLFFVIAPSFLMLEITHDSGKGVMNMLLVYLIGRYMAVYGLPKISTLNGGGYICRSHNHDSGSRFSRLSLIAYPFPNVGTRQQYPDTYWLNNRVYNGYADAASDNKLGEQDGNVCIPHLCHSRSVVTENSTRSAKSDINFVSDGLVQRHSGGRDRHRDGIPQEIAAGQSVQLGADEGNGSHRESSEESTCFKSRSKRLEWLDIAKGIGIIAVVLSHSHCSNLIWIVSACYVPVFFVCSGYTMRIKAEVTYWQFIKQKTRRLLIPYFFSMLLILSFNYLSGIVLHQPFDWYRSTVGVLYSRAQLYPMGVEPNQLMMPMNTQPMWFLTALLLAVVCTYPLIDRMKKMPLMVISPGVLLLSGYLLAKLPCLLPWSIDTLPLFVAMILFGRCIHDYGLLKTNWLVVLLLAMVYVCLLRYNGMVNFSIRQYGVSVLIAVTTALLGSFIIMKSSQWIAKVKWLCRPLSALGRHSLYIMCFHLPVLTVLSKLLESSTIGGVSLYALYLVSVVIAIAMGFGISVLINRYIPVLSK